MIISFNSSKSYSQIYELSDRNGQKNGFNFNEHKNDKIGILRAYNKKNRKGDVVAASAKPRKSK